MSSTSNQQLPTLYIIYNAKSTILGKLNYVYRKVTCPDPSVNPACAACELTHGPSLSLKESSEWKETKARISNTNIVQVHLDERPGLLFQWMKQHGMGTPAVIIEHTFGSDGDDAEPFRSLMTPEDLSRVRNDHKAFLQMLQSRINEANVRNVKIDMS